MAAAPVYMAVVSEMAGDSVELFAFARLEDARAFVQAHLTRFNSTLRNAWVEEYVPIDDPNLVAELIASVLEEE